MPHPTDSPAETMSQDLSTAKKAFADAAARQTPGTDLPRYLVVLDALLAWTAERPNQLTLAPAKRDDTLRFLRAGTSEPFWSAQVVRADAPKLEIHLASARPLSAEERAETMRTLNAHSREALIEGDRLRIGFGALKNARALAAILELMDWLLAEPAGRAPRDG